MKDMGDHQETEIKLRVASQVEARACVARAHAVLVGARVFEDNLILDDEQRSLRARGALLRVRRAGQATVVTFKGPRLAQDNIKSREEIEFYADGADAVLLHYRRLGLVPVFRYQKYRETYRQDDAEIVIDETPIGTFLEIEGSPEAIQALAGKMGFSPRDFIAESYAELFFGAGGQGDMVFP
ncbi:MAG: class IV adenylate cyclase [Vicinamibacteria bacterium]|jgi:adenylate cyclase class 2|nr:class IV adenylate cyclase [Vicinamibacteria bacterium]